MFFVGSLSAGGTERHISQVLPKLKSRGWDVRLAVLKDGGEFSSEINNSNIPINVLPSGLRLTIPKIRGVITLISQTISMAKLLNREKPDIFHCFLPTCCEIGGIAKYFSGGGKIIMSRRSQASRPQLFPGEKSLERWALRKANAVIGHSSKVMQELIYDGVSDSNLYLNRNGIDLNSFDKGFEGREKVRHHEGWKKDETIFIMVANLIPYKGHIDLVNAFSLLKQRSEPWRLVLIGTGNQKYTKQLHQIVDHFDLSENIDFLGKRSDIARLLNAADVGVLSSHQEGFSNAILEYMAASLPVVATSVGGNLDIVQEGINGVLAKPNSSKSLSKKLEKMLANCDDRKSMGIKGRKYVENKFSLEACIERYENIYRQVIKQ